MGIESKNDQECLIMGKGVAFGKKVGQTVSVTGDARVYSLKELTDRGEAKDIIKSVSPLCLELANEVLDQAEEEFGKVDRSILFTMADHLDFAVRRIQNGEQISNPLTDDIRIFPIRADITEEPLPQTAALLLLSDPPSKDGFSGYPPVLYKEQEIR